MVRVFVTGSEGFIGRHVCERLEELCHAVRKYDYVLDIFDDVQTPGVTDKIIEFNPDWIVHLAAQVFLGPSMTDPVADARANIIGTLNILEGARRCGASVLFSSSGAVYGNNYQYPEPISPYGLSKLTAENYLRIYNVLWAVKAVTFRFSSIYGEGRKKTSINMILDRAIHDLPITLSGDGTQTRDFTHVDDVVNAIVMAINGAFPSGTYDIGTGIATSLNELILLLERLLDKKLNVSYGCATVGDPKRNELNVSKAANYGFKARIQLAEGITRLIEELK